MLNKILHNPTQKSIIDYRIEEAVLDQEGNPVIDKTSGRPKWTGNTLEWTIRAGETKEFPGYVADYLKSIYDFLEVKKQPEDVKKKEEVKVDKKGKFVCKHCGKSFKSIRGLGLHIGLAHTKEIV